MRIGVPRALIVTMAGLFSGYHIVLGLYTIDVPRNPLPVLLAMVLYATATVISLLPGSGARMPIWMAAMNLVVCSVMPLLITPELDPAREGGLGYSTWYVAAIGTLLTITSTRLRNTFAWIGTAVLVLQTVVWAGPGMLLTAGVVGSVSWVAISHILSSALARASRDAARFAMAEREATDWQAAQEAHLYERQFRLGQTGSMAVPMLRIIERTRGELTEEQALECRYLEAAIRDEIRGRTLLDDAVRREVMRARRRGATVSLYDEGGLDDLPDEARARVHAELAAALEGTAASRLIIRTAPADSEIAVTVVGLTPAEELGDLGSTGEDDDEDEVDLWLEIPRHRSAVEA